MIGKNSQASDHLAACRKLSQQGVAAIEARRWAEAESLLAQALHECPDEVDARRYYAEALWHRGKRSEAVAQLQAVAERADADAAARVRLGEMLLAEGHLSAALREAEAAMDLAPGMAETWRFRARVLRKQGRLQPALADYQRSLAYAPEDRDALFEMASLYRQLGKSQEALAMLNILIDTYPLGEEPQEVIRAQCLELMALGRFSTAAERYRRLVATEGASADDFLSLAEAEWRSGSHERASRALQQALRLQPGHPRGQALMARLNRPAATTATRQR